MSITVDWYNDSHRILIFHVEGKWTWDDLFPQIQRSKELSSQVTHDKLVHTIFDMSESKAIPINAVSKLGTITKNQSPNAGITVLVTQSNFVNTLYNMASKQLQMFSRSSDEKEFNQVFHIVDSVEKAEQFLTELISSEVPS